jgi:hypothetical protein
MKPPSKREVMEFLLSETEARVHFDARKAGVDLPARLRSDPHLCLDYGYGFQPAIPDLSLDERGIKATLSFNRAPYETFVPWDAIYIISDFGGRGAVWQEDVPADLPMVIKSQNAPTKRSSHAREVDGVALRSMPKGAFNETAELDAIDGQMTTSPAAAPLGRFKSGRPRPSHLKLV